ncbi:MAG: thioredoxin domain-containing protein, partial [Patescibacteria group bacterium]
MPKKNATLAPEETLTSSATEGSACSNAKCGGCTGFRIWSAVFVVVLAQVASTAFFSDYTAKNTAAKMQEFEYSQRGGKETFDLLNKAQVLQLKGQIDQIKAYVESAEKNGGAKTDSATTPSAELKTMPKEEVEAIKKTSFFKGKEGATVIAVEYTDPECPFCIRQTKDGIISKLLEKYDGKLQAAHKVFRAVPHPGADPK